MLALKPEKSSKKEHLNLYNNITKRHKSANALTAIALTILHGYAKQRPGASNAL
jgi:hypothetical protein